MTHRPHDARAPSGRSTERRRGGILDGVGPAGAEDEPHRPARLPVRAGVVVDRDRPGRALRVTAHPDDDRVVLSTWQGERCVSTVRLDRTDVVQLLAALGIALLPEPGEPTGRAGAAAG